MKNLQQVWLDEYAKTPQNLTQVKNIQRAVTAFNTNIDAVIKINGEKIAKLIAATGLSAADLEITAAEINNPRDVVRGIIKCFASGIAEEWLCNTDKVYEWLQKNIGYDHLQMGGQGGIVGNVLAALGTQNVYVHTASHPKLQAEQFLNLQNLQAINEKGNWQKAHEINRTADIPLVHWIIEFATGEEFVFENKKYVCPKANRFIATYDQANLNLQINTDFIEKINQVGYDFLLLSGFHNLTTADAGLQRITESIAVLRNWRKLNPNAVMHLELASTQDKAIRAAILRQIAPLTDSIGLNEREALDALEIIDEAFFARIKNTQLTADILFDVACQIKQYCKVSRVQLHMLGLYITVQDKGFMLTAEQNKQGMMLASTVAATKAGWGKVDNYADLLLAHGRPVAERSLQELAKLAEHLQAPKLLTDGIFSNQKYDVIAVPTILIAKPLTLVGMGDTISSVSLAGALALSKYSLTSKECC